MLFQSYHSDPIDGTLYTPQLMKIPILLSSNHEGNGRESNDSQFGAYCASFSCGKRPHTTAIHINVKEDNIFLVFKKQLNVRKDRLDDIYLYTYLAMAML